MEQPTPREIEVLESVFRFFLQKQGQVPNDLVVDVSQQIGRLPWTIGGTMITPSAGTKPYYPGLGGITNAASLFEIFGLPADGIDVPPGMSESTLRTFVGNSISAPTIGTVLMVVLGASGLAPA